MFADESTDLKELGGTQAVQMIMGLLKETVWKLFLYILKNTAGRAIDRVNDRLDEKSRQKAMDKMRRKNNCGYREQEGALVSWKVLKDNKNELGQVRLSYTFNAEGKAVKHEPQSGKNGKPVYREQVLTGTEAEYAGAYRKDLKDLAQKHGVLCALGHEAEGLGGNGMFHSTLIFRKDNDFKCSQLMAELTIGDQARRVLVEQMGYRDAMNMSGTECTEFLKGQEYVNDLADRYAAEMTGTNRTFSGKDFEEKLNELDEYGGLDDFRDAFKQRFQTDKIDKASFAGFLKETLERTAADFDSNRNFMQKETPSESKVFYVDPKGGVHIVDLNDLKQVHFQDAKSMLSHAVKANSEILGELYPEVDIVEQISALSDDEAGKYVESMVVDSNELYREKAGLVDRKFQDHDLISDPAVKAALTDFETKGYDSALLLHCTTAREVHNTIDIAQCDVVDVNRLIHSPVDSNDYRNIAAILYMEDKYGLSLNNDVKDIIYSDSMDGQTITSAMRDSFRREADRNPLLLEDKQKCKDQMKAEIKDNKDKRKKIFGDKTKQPKERSAHAEKVKKAIRQASGRQGKIPMEMERN